MSFNKKLNKLHRNIKELEIELNLIFKTPNRYIGREVEMNRQPMDGWNNVLELVDKLEVVSIPLDEKIEEK